jgi:uncharacterized membrane protein
MAMMATSHGGIKHKSYLEEGVMESLLNEYSFFIFLLIGILLVVAVSRLGGAWRAAALMTGCVLMAAAIGVLVVNRTSDYIAYNFPAEADSQAPLVAPSVVQFYSNY